MHKYHQAIIAHRPITSWSLHHPVLGVGIRRGGRFGRRNVPPLQVGMGNCSLSFFPTWHGIANPHVRPGCSPGSMNLYRCGAVLMPLGAANGRQAWHPSSNSKAEAAEGRFTPQCPFLHPPLLPQSLSRSLLLSVASAAGYNGHQSRQAGPTESSWSVERTAGLE